MKNRLIRFFCGSVRFETIGSFPERFINLAQHTGLSLWDIKCENGRMTAEVTAKRYRRLHAISRKTRTRSRIISKHGLPFFLLPYRKRSGFALGAMLFFLTIWSMSNFIWVIEYPAVSQELGAEIISATDSLGIHPGARRSELDGEALGRLLEMSVSELSWASVNIFGSHLSIDVREYDSFIKAIPENTPCNIVAGKSGMVVKVDAFNGEPVVGVGDTVYEGELLISGVTEDATGSVHILHAQGSVTARTDYRFTHSISLNCVEPLPTGRVVTVRKMTLFGVELPLYIGRLPDGRFEKHRSETQLKLGRLSLPVTAINEVWTEKKEMNHSISKDEAYRRAVRLIEKDIAELGDITVIQSTEHTEYSGDGVTVTRDLTVDENIAVERIINFD